MLLATYRNFPAGSMRTKLAPTPPVENGEPVIGVSTPVLASIWNAAIDEGPFVPAELFAYTKFLVG